MLKPNTLALTTLLAMLVATGPLSTDIYLPSLPGLATDLSTDEAGAQLTLSVFLAGVALGQIFYGPVSDRFGRRPALLFALVVYMAGSVMCSFANDIDGLIISRFVQAIGAAGPMVLGRSIVRDLYEGTRAGQELSRMGAIMGIVPAIAPVLGAVLEILFDWRAAFITTLIFGFCTALWVYYQLPETIKNKRPEPLTVISIFASFGPMLKNRAFLINLAILCTTYAGLFAFISSSSFILQGVYGLNEIAFGLCYGLIVLAYILGASIGNRLGPKRGLDRTMNLGTRLQLAGGISMIGAALIPAVGPYGIVFSQMIYMVGLGITMPLSMAAALIPFPDRAGAASSLLGVAHLSFAALTGAIVGEMLNQTAWPLAIALLILGVLALLMSQISLIEVRNRNRRVS
ncbi:MAG: multidrug effflux MFS transporter [Cohaesibacteraceae bacterium]|nr:multidrug effflux MFS transporter [Cohaesibacteraceae bacterium]